MTNEEQLTHLSQNVVLGYEAECSDCEFTEFIQCGTNEHEAAVQLHANGWRYIDSDDEVGLFCSGCVENKEQGDEH